MKRSVFVIILCFCITAFNFSTVTATIVPTASTLVNTSAVREPYSRSACLMEASTGEILYAQNADEELEPASVTKIMSVLLIYEALSNGKLNKDDIVTAGTDAAEMGGSQIWLEVGEQMTVDEMLKAILVVSANDCTVAIAEHLSGSEEAFVFEMNKRAKELGMEHTSFTNCTGLPAENHYTCTKDIAIMTRELLKYDDVFSYTTIWTDSLRGGEMGLANTNKLIRFYSGANGMKTGFTSSAGYCMSATACRDGMTLIAAVMKADTSEHRFEDAKNLLNYGFSNFSVYSTDISNLPSVSVHGGKAKAVALYGENDSILLPKGRDKSVECVPELPKSVTAPIKSGETVGKLHYLLSGEEIAVIELKALNGVERMSLGEIFLELLSHATDLKRP